MKAITLSLFFVVLTFSGYAQIIAPDTVCVNEPVLFQSGETTTNHVTYAWEFGTQSLTPILGNATPFPGTGTNGGMLSVVGSEYMIQDSATGNYHAFVSSHGSFTVQRLDFGPNPHNTSPVVTDLGNPGGVFNNSAGNMEAVEVIRDDNGDWFVFIGNGTLVRMELGPNITNNSPVCTRLALPNQGMPMQVTITKFGNEWIGFGGHHWGWLARYEFGTSLANMPTVYQFPSFGGMLVNPNYFGLHEEGGNWYMLITNMLSGTTVRLSFGTDLKNNNPAVQNLGNIGGFSRINRGLITLKDCDTFFAMTLNESGEVGVLNFQNNILNNTPTNTNLGQVFGTGVSMQTLKAYWYDDTLWAMSGSFANRPTYVLQRLPLMTFTSGNSIVKYHDPTVTYTFTTPGVYTVSLYLDQGSAKGPFAFCKDIVVVSGRNNLLGPDTTICDGSSYTLDATQTGATGYAWSNGATTPSIVVTTPGTYSVQVSGNVCGTEDTVTVDFAATPKVDLGADRDACDGDVLTLGMTGGSSQYQYKWNTGDSTATIPVVKSGRYILRVSDRGCIDEDTVDIKFHTAPEVDLGPDISLCVSELPVILSSTQPTNAQFLWSNGLSSKDMTVTQSGKYWLEVALNTCKAADTINIEAIPDPHVYIGADSIICSQTPARIGTEVAGGSYNWSTGETTPYIHVSESGSYVLGVSIKGCTVYDTVDIIAMPDPDTDLGEDDDICIDQIISLDASYQGGSTYQWSTGETTPSIEVADPGTYSVIVTSEHGCVGGDTIVLSYYPDPIVMLGPDTSVCEETPLHIVPRTLNTDSLRWSDGSTGDGLVVKFGGEYIVTAINKCGTDTDTINVRQLFCNIWAPNAFSPNNDGLNDIFRILGNLGRLEGVTLSVFNRWGQCIYTTTDKYEGWDGYHNGEPVPMGTYVYLLQYSVDGQPYTRQGSFHLLR